MEEIIQQYQEDRLTRKQLVTRADALRKKIQALQAERWSDEGSMVEVEIDLKKARRSLAETLKAIETIDNTYLTALY